MVKATPRKGYIMSNTLFQYVYTMLSKCKDTKIEREKRNYFARAYGAVEMYIKIFPSETDDVLIRWNVAREEFVKNIFD